MSRLGLILATSGGIAVTLAAVYVIHEIGKDADFPSDTPPPEYLYLDSERTLAYLGEISGGLSDSEKRTESVTTKQSASLQGSLSADLAAERQRLRSVEQVVTPKATDRFISLLVELRRGKTRDDQGGVRPWLRDVDTRVGRRNSIAVIRRQLERVHEGDFLRMENARLFLAPYAAAVPKARYASSYLGGRIKAPPRPLYAPLANKARTDLRKYLARLGPDPSLLFVAPTLGVTRSEQAVVTFLIPARYSALLDNARLLVGNLTVVGKVVYKDTRTPAAESCGEEQARPTAFRCEYLDRQSLTTFAPALEKAPQSVLASLGMKRGDALDRVRSSVTFAVPLVVVLPLAIYQ